MHSIELSFFAVAFSFCLFSLWWTNQFFREFSLRFLKVFLALKAGQFALNWLILHPDSTHKPALLAAFMASAFLMAPCLWLFARETAAGKPPSVKALGFADWGTILVGALLCIPLFAVATGSTEMRTPESEIDINKSIWVHGTMLLCVGLYLYQVPRYLFACNALIKKQTAIDKLWFSNTAEMPLQSLKVLL
jgi:hypothetical protein